MIWSTEREWQFANVDRLTDDSDEFIVELKTPRYFDPEYWGKAGTDQTPPGYLVQLGHQQATVREKHDFSYLAAFAAGSMELRIYIVPRNQRLIDRICELEEEFVVKYLNQNVSPPPDYTHERTSELIELLNKPIPEKTIELFGDAVGMVERYLAINAVTKELDTEKDGIRSRLIEMMTDATIGNVSNGAKVARGKQFRITPPKKGK
jgi:predicted phage-related endonuclease